MNAKIFLKKEEERSVNQRAFLTRLDMPAMCGKNAISNKEQTETKGKLGGIPINPRQG